MRKITKVLMSIALAIPTLFGSLLLSTFIMPSESVSAPLETSVATNPDLNGGGQDSLDDPNLGMTYAKC